MARNRTREALRNSVMSTLGFPVVKVNLTVDQLNTAIDDSMKVLWRWHQDYSFENYYVYTLTADDVTNNYIVIPEYFDSVIDIIPRTYPWGDMAFTSPIWQMEREVLNSTVSFQAISLVDYVAMSERLYNLQSVLGHNLRPYTYVRFQHRVIPHFKLNEGELVVMKVLENVDAERSDPAQVESSLMFDDDVLKKLAVAHSKRIWGNILTRFRGMTLPGNVQIDGDALLSQADKEIDQVIDYLQSQTVIDFQMG